jgi:hypothetical protein
MSDYIDQSDSHRMNLQEIIYLRFLLKLVGQDSSVGIATSYGLDGPGIESRFVGGGDFLHPSRPALGPSQPPIQ